jgi:hypothetical protein
VSCLLIAPADALADDARDAFTVTTPRLADRLLEGHDDITPDFRQWVIETRQSWHTNVMRALADGYNDGSLVRNQRRRLAEAALLQDPTDEQACRTLMRLAAEDSEISAALRAYDTLYRSLAEELDMEPSDATQALVAEIKMGQVHPLRFPPAPTIVVTRFAMPRLAVMPMRVLGRDAVARRITEGLIEDLVSSLSEPQEVTVVSTSFTSSYRGSHEDLDTVARDLSVQYALISSVQGKRQTADTFPRRELPVNTAVRARTILQ